VTTLVGNSSFLDQDGLEHGSPLSSGTLLNNGGSGDLNGWGDVRS
jgi:protein quaking